MKKNSDGVNCLQQKHNKCNEDKKNNPLWEYIKILFTAGAERKEKSFRIGDHQINAVCATTSHQSR